MQYGETIAVCSEVHTEHVKRPESYYTFRSYHAENWVLSIYIS
jgi:hypothetical protein